MNALKYGPFLLLVLVGCATIPGKTRQAQLDTMDNLIERTLADLVEQHPEAKDQIGESVGYVVMSNEITKVPVFGAGGGYGVAVNNKTGEKTYLRMVRFDIGAGWGARSVRPVLIFNDVNEFKRFIDGVLRATIGTEAAAKLGDKGAAASAAASGASEDTHGYKSYLITDGGVSATASFAVTRVKPVKLKREKH
ncbi:MAG: hypothetical protein KCHDKBKB_02233 [Elusimicrobia bacterium]|nr:hypothetical protein [Elusimicrobiota bacterium]